MEHNSNNNKNKTAPYFAISIQASAEDVLFGSNEIHYHFPMKSIRRRFVVQNYKTEFHIQTNGRKQLPTKSICWAETKNKKNSPNDETQNKDNNFNICKWKMRFCFYSAHRLRSPILICNWNRVDRYENRIGAACLRDSDLFIKKSWRSTGRARPRCLYTWIWTVDTFHKTYKCRLSLDIIRSASRRFIKFHNQTERYGVCMCVRLVSTFIVYMTIGRVYTQRSSPTVSRTLGECMKNAWTQFCLRSFVRSSDLNFKNMESRNPIRRDHRFFSPFIRE